MSEQKLTIYFVISLFLIILFLPVTQGVFHFFPEEELFGITEKTKRPTFSFSGWINKTFQKDFETWIDGKLGLRGFFVKTDNEINYLLFNEIHQKTGTRLIVGEDNYLFEYNYIETYLGKDYEKTSILRKRVEELKRLQDILKEKGIALIFLMSPSKASFYSEHIPRELVFDTAKENPETNYKRILPILEENKINYFDSLNFFLEKKENTDYPLFSKSGTHWTRYGSCLVLEKLIEETSNQLNSNFLIPDCSNVDISSIPKYEDRDLADLSNLWYKKMFFQDLAYPQFQYDPENINDIRLLMIGDSFSWGILSNIRESGAMIDYNFYYYFNSDYNNRNIIVTPVTDDKEVLKEIILSKNLIIIEATETALNNVGFGFIETAIDAFSE